MQIWFVSLANDAALFKSGRGVKQGTPSLYLCLANSDPLAHGTLLDSASYVHTHFIRPCMCVNLRVPDVPVISETKECFLNEQNGFLDAAKTHIEEKGEEEKVKLVICEIVGFARAMLKCCRKVEGMDNAVDIVGTGGVGQTINISTGAAIHAATCGAKVAKQGNRSSSSACRCADVLEALGVVIDLEPEVKDELHNQRKQL